MPGCSFTKHTTAASLSAVHSLSDMHEGVACLCPAHNTHDGLCENLPAPVCRVPPALLCCAREVLHHWVLAVLDVHYLKLGVAIYTHHVLNKRCRLVQHNLPHTCEVTQHRMLAAWIYTWYRNASNCDNGRAHLPKLVLPCRPAKARANS